jgi:hypothetical protein
VFWYLCLLTSLALIGAASVTLVLKVSFSNREGDKTCLPDDSWQDASAFLVSGLDWYLLAIGIAGFVICLIAGVAARTLRSCACLLGKQGRGSNGGKGPDPGWDSPALS